MTQHDPRPVTQAGPGTRSASFGWCPCGWRGPVRTTRAEAQADADGHPVEEYAPVTVIDADEYEAALHDPKVHQAQAAGRAYGTSLIARGHCRCHLVVNCPDGGDRKSSEGNNG